MTAPKQETITFKVDAGLAKALDKLPNRSQFIRSAVLAALEGACPLCQGTGQLSADQKKHWDEFSNTHAVERCDDCQSVVLTCRKGVGKSGARTSKPKGGKK